MIFKIFSLYLYYLFWIRQVSSELPPGVTPCSKSLALNDYNGCIVKQLELLTPQLIKGVPSLRLPPLDPLALPSLVVDRNLESIRVKANLTNVKVYGGSNYVINELKASPSDLKLYLKIQLPYMYVKGNYDVKGNLLVIPLGGNGFFSGNFSNTQVIVRAEGKEVDDKNGVERIILNKLMNKIRVGDGSIALKAPQGPQSFTADAAASFFNSNQRLVLDIINPIIEETSASIGKALAARALGALTKTEILPV